MDDDLQQLEAELKELRPANPRPTLQSRLQCELDLPVSAPAAGLAKRKVEGRTFWWWSAALPIAAAIVLALVLRSRAPLAVEAARGSAPVAELAPVQPGFKPVAARNLLYAADDEGMVTLDDGTPARRERLHFVDTITWRNPRTNASLTWSVPREEVRIVPVNFQ